jgi:hypothetical protein
MTKRVGWLPADTGSDRYSFLRDDFIAVQEIIFDDVLCSDPMTLGHPSKQGRDANVLYFVDLMR